MTLQEAIERIEATMHHTLEVERANKKAGSPAESTACDAGRYPGIREALLG